MNSTATRPSAISGTGSPAPLDAIARRDVEARFNRITEDHGWSPANRAMSLLRSVYRRPCVDLEGLRNPVDLWLAGGGKFHRKVRRKISTPAEVLPCWRAGIEAEVNNPAIRDALWFGLYTGMRWDEVLTLRWERVDMAALTFRVEETKTGVPLELPVTGQLRAILERRQSESEDLPADRGNWVNVDKEERGRDIGALARSYFSVLPYTGEALDIDSTTNRCRVLQTWFSGSFTPQYL